MLSLHELGLKHVTDKAGPHPVHDGGGEGHRFCDFYDPHLSFLRDREFKLLEIGIFDGASLRMWAEYFPKATIFGIDALIDSRALLVNEGRIRSFQMDQGDQASLRSLNDRYGPFTVVIDDGSHRTHHQWISYKMFVNSPVFIWEDLHTSRDDRFVTSPGILPLDHAKALAEEHPETCFFYDKDGDEKHCSFLAKNYAGK
jgi:hypothetical protein